MILSQREVKNKKQTNISLEFNTRCLIQSCVIIIFLFTTFLLQIYNFINVCEMITLHT